MEKKSLASLTQQPPVCSNTAVAAPECLLLFTLPPSVRSLVSAGCLCLFSSFEQTAVWLTVGGGQGRRFTATPEERARGSDRSSEVTLMWSHAGRRGSAAAAAVLRESHLLYQ